MSITYSFVFRIADFYIIRWNIRDLKFECALMGFQILLCHLMTVIDILMVQCKNWCPLHLPAEMKCVKIRSCEFTLYLFCTTTYIC